MAINNGDVIDLSDSFILADHHALTNVVIELDTDESGLIELDSDNSFVELASPTTVNNSQVVQARKSNRRPKDDLLACIYHKQQTKLKSQKTNPEITSSEQSKFGDCPICFDPLGHNPLASTKCGHVYCMTCIKQYLLVDQRCPTCRQNLKGKSAYHPLYLNR